MCSFSVFFPIRVYKRFSSGLPGVGESAMSINRFLAHYTWSEVAALDKTDGVVILPIGAVEQHGHHLPLLTDTLIVNRMLDRKSVV